MASNSAHDAGGRSAAEPGAEGRNQLDVFAVQDAQQCRGDEGAPDQPVDQHDRAPGGRAKEVDLDRAAINGDRLIGMGGKHGNGVCALQFDDVGLQRKLEDLIAHDLPDAFGRFGAVGFLKQGADLEFDGVVAAAPVMGDFEL